MPKLAILLPDIVDSTPLFVSRGDAAALGEIGRCIDLLRAVVDRHGGRCVHTRGDDVLSVFTRPEAALAAAEEILRSTGGDLLAVHAGLHFGNVIESRGVIFGEAVIICARLAGIAKAGEVLASHAFVRALGGECPAALRAIDPVLPKGTTKRIPVFSMTVEPDDTLRHTALDLRPPDTLAGAGARRREGQLRLEINGEAHIVRPGQRVSIGRSPDCDLVARSPWVSRQHAHVSFKSGRIELTDQSSLGTWVLLDASYQFLVHRETVVLPVEGVISPVMKPRDEQAELIRFAVV